MATSDDKPIFAAEWATRLRNFTWKPRHPHKVLYHQTEPLQARIVRLRTLHARSRLADRGFFISLISNFLTRLIGPAPQPIVSLLISLADENWQIFDFPEIPLRSFSGSEVQALTDLLDEAETRIRYEDQIRERFLTRVGEVIHAYSKLLPDTPSHLTVPLVSPQLIAHALLHFCDAQPDSILFYAYNHTREQLYRNLFAISGITPEMFEKNPNKVVPPDEYDGDILDYVAGTPLHDFFATQVPFVVPRELWREHAAMFAPSGHGKTQALQAIILDFLQNDCPALFIIDSHGDMLRKVRALNPPGLVVIDPEAAEPPALNFLDFKGNFADVVELFGYLMSALSADLSSSQSTMVAFILRLMAAIPDATIDTLRQVMEDPAKNVDKSRFAKEIATLDSIAQDYFANQFFAPGTIAATKQSVARRIYALMANPTFAKMFSAKRNTFDAFRAMQDKRIVLINTSMKLLRAEASSVFGRYMLAQILAAAYRRVDVPERDRHLALVIVDEAGPYMDNTTERILTETRKFGVSLLLATQFLEQLPVSVKAAINGNTSIKFAGPVSYSDANALGREMYTGGEFLRSMRKTTTHTEFACYVKTVTPEAVRVSIPFGIMERAEPFAPSEEIDTTFDYHADLADEEPSSATTAPVSPPPRSAETPTPPDQPPTRPAPDPSTPSQW